MKNNLGISIIVTAYKAQDFIKETLDSVAAQSWFKNNDNYEILLGIDNCPETLETVKNIMNDYKNLTVIYMKENYGTYVVSNTLISLAKYKWILRFDSDDIMRIDMVESIFDLISVQPKTDIIQFYFEKFSTTKEIKKQTNVAHGIICANKNTVYDIYGGYLPWKCAADTELLTRLKSHVIFKEIPKILFYYRIHDKSLTQNESTSMKSKLRMGYKKYIKTESENNPIIKTVTGDYDIISKNETNTIVKHMQELEDKNTVKHIVMPVTKKEYLKLKRSHNYYGV